MPLLTYLKILETVSSLGLTTASIPNELVNGLYLFSDNKAAEEWHPYFFAKIADKVFISSLAVKAKVKSACAMLASSSISLSKASPFKIIDLLSSSAIVSALFLLFSISVIFD